MTDPDVEEARHGEKLIGDLRQALVDPRDVASEIRHVRLQLAAQVAQVRLRGDLVPAAGRQHVHQDGSVLVAVLVAELVEQAVPIARTDRHGALGGHGLQRRGKRRPGSGEP